MEQAKRSKRKSVLFSVSFKPEDLEELQHFLEDMRDENGVALSRNELIRRSMLAHVRFMEYSKGEITPIYQDVFKNIK